MLRINSPPGRHGIYNPSLPSQEGFGLVKLSIRECVEVVMAAEHSAPDNVYTELRWQLRRLHHVPGMGAGDAFAHAPVA